MRSVAIIVAAACLAPAAALAQDMGSPQSTTLRGGHAINGTWRFDPATAKMSDKPERFGVQGGVFTCDTCDPRIRVAADGAYHRLPGHPYWDEIKVDAAGADHIDYAYRKGGKLVGTATDAVSPDGATLTTRRWSIANMAAKPIESATVSSRVGPAPAGAHRASGEWRLRSQTVATPDATRLTFLVDRGAVTVTEPTGETVVARLDGPFASNKGDPGGTEYAYAAPSDHVLLERSRRAGKETASGRYTVSPDGRTMTAVFTSKRDGGITTVTATKE